MTNRNTNQLPSFIAALLAACTVTASAVTFSEALDINGLVWSTGGDNAWIATNATGNAAYDGVDVAVSVITHNQTSWLETTVTGPGELSFWWSCSTEATFDPVILYVDDEEADQISGEQNWKYGSYLITNTGPVVLRWEYSRDSSGGGANNNAKLDQVKYNTGPVIPLATALNTDGSYAIWTTGGNTNSTYWEGQTNNSRADGMAAESGAIYTSQESWMETTVWGVTNVSFWWKVSSKTNSGRLSFVINGVTNSVITGEVGWQLKTNISLGLGTNTLRWVISTDELAVGKLNRGWIDEVSFSPTFIPSSSIRLSQPVVTNGVAQFNVTNKIGWPCKVFYSTNLAANQWTLLLETNSLTSATLNVTDPGATNSSQRFYRAQSP